MMNRIYEATVNSLIRQADVDFRLSEVLHYISDADYETDEAEGSDIFKLAEYIDSKHLPISYNGNMNTSDYSIFLCNTIDKIMANNTDKIVFRQSYRPYWFKVSSTSFTIFLPLILTRAFMCLLKVWGIKCEAEKRDRSLCSELDIFLTELCFTGKSSIDIPEFKPVVEACKKLKGKINPWFKEDEVVNTQEIELYNEANLRFRGAEWFEAAKHDVTLIGAGGLGSNIAVSLCRVLGNSYLTIYDPDIVEHKNLAGQNFGVSDIGRNKVSVVAEQCNNFNPELHLDTRGRFDERSFCTKITITGLDNMTTRKLVFSKWQGQLSEDSDNKDMLLIDARLSAEKWQIFCITGDNKATQEEYENNWLFSDDEADSDVCSYKQTAFAAQMCASFVTNLYINFCTNSLKDDDDPLRRYLPFMTEYDASQMILRYKEVI